MENNETVYIDFEKQAGQIFNEDIGWLSMPKAGKIKVSVKGYKEKKQELEAIQKKERDELYRAYTRNWDNVDALEKNSEEFVKNSETRYNSGKISAETHQANLNARGDGNKQRNAEKKKLTDKFKDDSRKLTETQAQQLADLKKEYVKIRWVWQLIGSDRPVLKSTSFNEALDTGNPALELNFGDFLEGGGAAYIEPFLEGTTPVGRYPHGIIVNAIGQKSNIITADWRDASDEKITDVLKFGSTVYLNIYTEALYGHNIKIILKDKDKLIRVLSLGLTNADDKLFAAEYLNNNVEVEDREETDIQKKENQFIRAVSVHSTTKHPENAKYGRLIDQKDEDIYDKNVTTIPNVQKCKFAVFIDPMWEILAGSELEIYPEIEHPKIPGKIKILSESILKIGNEGRLLKVEEINSNKVVSISHVETDMIFFHPCKYTQIIGNYKKKDNIVFDVNDVEKRFVTSVNYLLVAGDKKDENYTLTFKMPNLTTDDCNFEDDPEQTHESHAIKIINKEHFKDLKIDKNQVSFNVTYPKPSIPKGESMMDSENIVPITYSLQLSSCAISHPIKVEVYPDVYYELGFKFMTENPYYVGQSKAYTDRKYLGKWGFFDKRTNKKVRKEQQSQRKQNYKNTKQEVSEGRLEYSQFEFFMEYGYNDVKESNITFSGDHPVFSVIDSVMWVINTMGKLTFSKEADEARKEHDDERPNEVKKRNKKRNTYLGGKGKPLSKIPFKVQVDQPTFAGSVKWCYKESEKEAGQIGTLYTLNFKADPLISAKGSLDLLFVATKIPYVAQAVQAITAVADTVGSSDDFWNSIVDLFGGSDKYKIQIDVDYYLDLFVSGEFKIEATALQFHTIDRFGAGSIQPVAELKFGIECGGSLKVEIGEIYSMSAEIEGKAEAVWQFTKDADKNALVCKYQGLYAIIDMKVETSDGIENAAGDDGDGDPDTKKFLLHDGFSYEFRLD